MRGIAASAVAPNPSGRTGTSRQPTMRAPSTRAYFSSTVTARASSAGVALAGRKNRPVAYWPAGGSAKSTTAR